MKRFGLSLILIFLGVIVVISGCVNISPPTQGDPSETAGFKSKVLLTKIGVPETTNIVSFDITHFLDAQSISAKNGYLSSNQICLDVSSNIGEEKDLYKIQNNKVEYVGSKESIKKLLVICDISNNIDESVNSNGVREAFPNCTGNQGSEIQCFVSVVSKNYSLN